MAFFPLGNSFTHRFTRFSMMILECLHVESGSRTRRPCRASFLQHLPEVFRVIGAPWQSATHANNGNWFHVLATFIRRGRRDAR